MQLIKTLVSTPKQTFKSSHTTLDLAYITPNLIVAAGPTDTSKKALYRDNVAHIVAHLDQAHGRGHWHVWNLRGEDPGYAFNAVIGPRCSYRPIPDHQVPTFQLMEQVAQEFHNFLEASEKNVALVHCKEGKGRSGTICCGYLMYEAQKRGILVSVEEIVAKFTAQRMRKLFGPGVSISSQLRFLGYWKTYLEVSAELKSGFLHAPLRLSGVVFNTSHKLLKRSRLVFFEHEGPNLGMLRDISMAEFRKEKTFPVNLVLAGVSLLKVSVEFHGSRCYCWVSPYFEILAKRKRPVNDGLKGVLKLHWDEWDGFWGTKWKGPVKLFESAEIHWEARAGE